MTIDLTGANVMVTGGAGFLGRHVVECLTRRGAKALAIRSSDYDLTQPDRVRAAFADSTPRYAIHCAAVVGGIGANRSQPARFFYENATMGIHAIHEAWRAGVEKLVVVGTVCSYPKLAPIPFSVNDLWSGYPEETNAPYGLAKKMLLVQAQAYRAEYGFNAIYVIPTNIYGPGDSFDLENGHVIPAIIRRCLEAKDTGRDEVSLWGTGDATRDFVYVTDAAEAIVLALEHYDAADAVNVGSGREVSIRELAELVAESTGFRGRFTWDSAQPDGQPRRLLDLEPAKSLFGFSASVPLHEGLRRTIDWYARADASS